MKKGNTEKILIPFLDGMKKAGAAVKLVYAKHLSIKPCLGDFQCWYKTVGECIHRDDMQTLYPQIRKSNILILGTPVYIPLPGEMQNFINRLCPILEPFLEFKTERTRAHFHKDVNLSKIVLVSSCGWWEMANFDTVIRIVKELALEANCEFAGAVLRPHASELQNYPKKAKEVFEAAKDAGFELVKQGSMSEETLRSISQPLVSEKELRDRYNMLYLDAKRS